MNSIRVIYCFIIVIYSFIIVIHCFIIVIYSFIRVIYCFIIVIYSFIIVKYCFYVVSKTCTILIFYVEMGPNDEIQSMCLAPNLNLI